MSNNTRYSILGLGRPRSRWFSDVATWTTSGVVPAEFHKCLSATDVRRRLSSLQPFSAVLLEEGVADVDRSLLEFAKQANAATLVICPSTTSDEWIELGATATLPTDLTPSDLIQALFAHANVTTATPESEIAATIEQITTTPGALIAVCGAGGTGTSTLASAFAQSLADDITATDHVLLADFTRNSEQAMLHNSPEVSPGIEEAIEANRLRRASSEQLRQLTFAVQSRGYRLLLGQRRVGAWTAFSPAAIRTTISGLRQSFRFVVADVTADFESESHSGSIDISERNALALTAVTTANLTFVVGTPGLKGVHALVRTMKELVDAGADSNNVIPVVNRAPKSGLARLEITKAITSLSAVGKNGFDCNAPLFITECAVEDAQLKGTRLPKQLTKPLNSALTAFLHQSVPSEQTPGEPEPVIPGSLGIGRQDAV